MFEKDLKKAYLLDVYGDVLSSRKKDLLDMYYNEDLSLAEIAEQVGISRQGVRDMIKKGEDELAFLEEKLHLAKRLSSLSSHAEKLVELSRIYSLPDDVMLEIDNIAKDVK